jgi:hypothetical protein
MEAKMNLTAVRFGKGTHTPTAAPTGRRDLCIMEAVAFMAGEPWSDRPVCASPVIAAMLRSWNDALLLDDDRDRLLPADVWVPRLINSRGNKNTEITRLCLVFDWFVRVYTPAWLDLVPALMEGAAVLRGLPKLDLVSLQALSAQPPGSPDPHICGLNNVEKAAEEAKEAYHSTQTDAQYIAKAADTRYTVGFLLGASLGHGAREASWAHSRDVHDLALNAWHASYDAAYIATAQGTDTKPTITALQQGALDLLDRMLLCREPAGEEGK